MYKCSDCIDFGGKCLPCDESGKLSFLNISRQLTNRTNSETVKIHTCWLMSVIWYHLMFGCSCRIEQGNVRWPFFIQCQSRSSCEQLDQKQTRDFLHGWNEQLDGVFGKICCNKWWQEISGKRKKILILKRNKLTWFLFQFHYFLV